MHCRVIYFAVLLLCLVACAKDTTEEPAELADVTPEAELVRQWRMPTGADTGANRILLKPWYSNTSIFIAGTEGQLLALDRETGKKRWEIDTGVPLTGGVGGGSGMLFVGTDNGQLLAFWQRNGEKIWEAELGGEMLAPPATDQGVVVARTTDGSLKAYLAGTGEPLWTYRYSVPSLSLVGTATPVIYSGGVICGGDDGRLTVVRLDTGQLLWDLPVAVSTGASELSRVIDINIPVVLDGQVMFTAAYQGRIAALAIRNGQMAWARDRSVHLPMDLDGYNLYVVDSRSFIWALNKYNGATVWVQEALRARPTSGVAVYKDMVVIGDFEGYLHVLDAADGRILARKDLGARIAVQPHVDEDHVYAINRKGVITAFEIKRFVSNK